MEYKALIMGHITMDINVEHTGEVVKTEGGAVLYSSAAAYGMGHKVAVLTKLNKDDYDRLKAFTLPSDDVFCIEALTSTDMYNKYLSADKELRDSKCSSRGDPFCIDDVPPLKTKIYHFAGLLYGDYPEEMIKELSCRGKVAVDVQGYLRHRNEVDGKMFFLDWEKKKEYFPYIDFLKTDAYEAQVLTGLTDRKEAAKLMYSWGAKEIIITHNTEVLIYDGKEFFTCPIKARNLSGRTGRGDTTFAIYMNERLSHGIKKSLLYATAAVSLKMETPGVFSKTRIDVEDYIETFYKEESNCPLLTAHGGALNTGRNTPRFFEVIKDHKVDVVEVDIQKRGNHLYISHMPKLFGHKECLTLAYVFEFAAQYGFKVNCDVKKKGIVKDVLNLARELNVLDKIIFTGSVSRKDIPYLTDGIAYLNKSFFFPKRIKKENMQKIKDIITSLNNPRVKGINFKHTFLSEDVLEECQRIALPISTFTIDEEVVLEAFCKKTYLHNITTNKPDTALEYLKGEL